MFLHVDDNNFITLFYSGPPDKLRKLFESIKKTFSGDKADRQY